MSQTKAELLQTKHQGELRLGDADSSKSVGFKAPATVGTDVIWTLPATDGSNGYALTTNGSGVLSWSQDASGIPASGGTFTGTVTFENDVTFDGATAGRDIVFDRSENALEFTDNAQATFGSSIDLKIWHDGANSRIKDSGAGALMIGASTLQIENPGESKVMAKFIENGAVELYHDNVKRFNTTTAGVQLTGSLAFMSESTNIAILDNGKAKFGNGDDLQILHTGVYSLISNTTGDLVIRNTGDTYLQSDNNVIIGDVGNNEKFIRCIDDGAVELYHDNDLKFFTKSTGVEVTTTGAVTDFIVRGKEGFGASISLASDDGDDPGDYARILQHTNEHLYFQVYNAANNAYEDAIVAKHDGAVELYFDNVKKYETSAAGSKFTGGISQVVTAVSALELDLSTSNYFTKTISGNSTFTFVNPAASGQVTAFTLELTHSSGTVAWPSSVKFNSDTAPTLTTGKTHLFMFVTDDGGTRYRGSALVDYVN